MMIYYSPVLKHCVNKIVPSQAKNLKLSSLPFLYKKLLNEMILLVFITVLVSLVLYLFGILILLEGL